MYNLFYTHTKPYYNMEMRNHCPLLIPAETASAAVTAPATRGSNYYTLDAFLPPPLLSGLDWN